MENQGNGRIIEHERFIEHVIEYEDGTLGVFIVPRNG